MCEDISIADDFDVRLSVVSGGVSQLIRPAETKLTLPDIFQSSVSVENGGALWTFSFGLKSNPTDEHSPSALMWLKSNLSGSAHLQRWGYSSLGDPRPLVLTAEE